MRTSIIAIIFSLILFSCTTQKKAKDETAEIAVSILPQKFFVDRITDSTINTLVMIPGSKSPATYEPLPSQVEALSSVKVYFKIGYIGFELSWMDKFADANPEMKITDLSAGIELIEGECTHDEGEHDHHHHGIDPHIWMSPENCIKMSSNILNTLTELFPEKRQEFLGNYNDLIAELESIQQHIDSVLMPYDQRDFLIFHPALTYYAHDYGLIQTPIELGGSEPSLKHMVNVMEFIKAKGINDIFIQRQFDRKNAETLVRETNGEIIEIDPLDYYWTVQIMDLTEKMQKVLKEQNAK